MFIELAEYLRCPDAHGDRTYCVLVPHEMVGRDVVQGTVGCPLCKREYVIEDSVARCDGEEGRTAAPAAATPDPQVLQALLGLASPGGYVVLVGDVAHAAAGLAEFLGGVQFVAVNPPTEVRPSPTLSVLEATARIPLKSAMARGVVLGSDTTGSTWAREGARVLLPGLRLIARVERLVVAGVSEIASGDGLWVGEKEQPGTRGGKRKGRA